MKRKKKKNKKGKGKKKTPAQNCKRKIYGIKPNI